MVLKGNYYYTNFTYPATFGYFDCSEGELSFPPPEVKFGIVNLQERWKFN